MINYKMSVHLFRVFELNNAPPLENLFPRIQADALPERLRTVANYQMRLEHIAPPNTDGNRTRFWFLDFTKLRFEHGPGKVGTTTPIEGFALNDDEGFGEETAALYDPQTKYMIVQYNHHGVRAASIQEYFSTYFLDPNQVSAYQLRIQLDGTADARLAHKRVLTKLQFKVAPPQITAAHRNANVGLSRALDFNDRFDGANLEVVIQAEKGGALNFQSATSLINKLKELVAVGEAGGERIVSKFEVVGKDDPVSRNDAINMLAPKLESVVDQLQLGLDRRFTLESRWRSLARARNGWTQYVPD
ncbi:hypothetical protein E4K72_14190 [Oxalobacteraceae bacterium OM1]|nr:hypothetical protein E4K72_14190 [Oxalobacteraceae bacterium OM1]